LRGPIHVIGYVIPFIELPVSFNIVLIVQVVMGLTHVAMEMVVAMVTIFGWLIPSLPRLRRFSIISTVCTHWYIVIFITRVWKLTPRGSKIIPWVVLITPRGSRIIPWGVLITPRRV
jgi:hypothetical protein